MRQTNRPSKPHRCRPAALLLLLALLLTLLPGLPAAAEEERDRRTITISAVGDCTLGRCHKMIYYESWDHMYDKYGSGYFLKNVEDIFRGDDLTIANLEGVLSESADRRSSFFRQKTGNVDKKEYCHLGRPEYARLLVKGGVDAVSFANNHNIDYGLKGFTDTVEACAACGLPVAYYDTLARCEVQGLTVGILSVDASYCSLETAEEYLRAGMADLNRDCDLIVACMHWGRNYQKQASKEQVMLGHLCVELGADLVLGCHAHILQGVERYKGRYIFYSLGNFCYGGRLDPKDVDTVIAQQTFTFVDGELQLDDAVRLIPCWMSSRKDINDYVPTVQTGDEAARVLKKINTRSKRFGVAFDAEGRPKMNPAKDTAIPPAPVAAAPLEAETVPEIIRTLLDTKQLTSTKPARDTLPLFSLEREKLSE